jgi:uncharacterized protein
MGNWDFYGRNQQLEQLKKLIERKKWFFCHIQGRRRIGKTSLIKQLAKIDSSLSEKIIYLQIPDSDEVDIASAFLNAIKIHDNPKLQLKSWQINNFQEMSNVIGELCQLDFIIVLDEFQYFASERLSPFRSFLQKQIDSLVNSDNGGIFILGSVVHEMNKLLEDSSSPLYSRITEHIDLIHWDFEDLNYVFKDQNITNPYHWLSLWSFFEGVPKFYYDLYNHNVLSNPTDNLSVEILTKMFLTGSSPLKEEVNTWFLRDIKGQQLSVINYLGANPGSNHGDIVSHINGQKTGKSSNPSIIIKNLIENFKLIDKQNPVFSDSKNRNARYYINDNFLQAWIKFIHNAVEKSKFSSVERIIDKVMPAIYDHEGLMFEKLIRQIHVECSKKNIGDFPLTGINLGYWNKPKSGNAIEIDLIALNEDSKIIRFGSCKRKADSHDSEALKKFEMHINNFFKTSEGEKHIDWEVEKTLFSPVFEENKSIFLQARGYKCYDLKFYSDLFFKSSNSV